MFGFPVAGLHVVSGLVHSSLFHLNWIFRRFKASGTFYSHDWMVKIKSHVLPMKLSFVLIIRCDLLL